MLGRLLATTLVIVAMAITPAMARKKHRNNDPSNGNQSYGPQSKKRVPGSEGTSGAHSGNQ